MCDDKLHATLDPLGASSVQAAQGNFGIKEDPLKALRSSYNTIKEGVFGQQKSEPRPDLERLKAEEEAARAANTNLAFSALKKRRAAGRLEGGSVLAAGAPVDSTILASGANV